jgi:hypothetical protein
VASADRVRPSPSAAVLAFFPHLSVLLRRSNSVRHRTSERAVAVVQCYKLPLFARAPHLTSTSAELAALRGSRRHHGAQQRARGRRRQGAVRTATTRGCPPALHSQERGGAEGDRTPHAQLLPHRLSADHPTSQLRLRAPGAGRGRGRRW